MPSSTCSTRISFVRHGHVHNPEQVVYGRLPGFGLSELGKQQAEAAASYLRDAPLPAVFSSPMLRARQTAEYLLRYHRDVPLIIAEAINEVRFFFEGHPMETLTARNWDLYTGVGPEYEQPADLIQRVQPWLTQVRAHYAGQQVAAVTHGDVIAFTVLWANAAALIPANKHTLDDLGLRDEYPAPGSITTFTFSTSDPDERPTVTYVRPYGEALMDQGTSPK